MKNAVFVILVLLFVPTIAHAQVDEQYDYARAYQDYVFTQDTYDSSLSDYRLARSQYLQAQTLVAQTKARDATVKMLTARDDVIIAYLTAIRLRLTETEGIGEVTRTGIQERIDSEVSWFRDHKSRISSAGTLDDLVDDSDEANDRFQETEKIAYEALSLIAGGKVDVLRGELSSILSQTREKSFEIESNGDYDISVVQRWLEEIEQKITRSLDKSIEAQSLTQEFYGKKGDKASGRSDLFNDVTAAYSEAMQLLRDGNNFMKEILKGLTG